MPRLPCHFCGAAVTIGEPIPRDGECDSCRRDLRCCRNCRHYDVRYNNSCRETMAEPVEDKERRNFCEYFVFSREAFQPAAANPRAAEARAKLDALFGGAASRPDKSADAKARLESLFRKSDPEVEGRDPDP